MMIVFSFPCSSEWVACVRSNFLVLCYLHDVKNILQLHDLATGAHLKTFPLDVGSIVGYSGQKKDNEIFYQFTSFLSPGKVVVVLFFSPTTHCFFSWGLAFCCSVGTKYIYNVDKIVFPSLGEGLCTAESTSWEVHVA